MPGTPVQRFYYFLHMLGINQLTALKEHGVTDFKYLGAQLQEQVVEKLSSEFSTRSKRPRSTVIHYLCIMPNYDYKTAANEPNYEKIDEWVKSKFKKELNLLSLAELNRCVGAVKGWYQKELKKVK